MSQKRKVIFSFFIAIGFLFLSYWITNLHVPISGEKVLLTACETIRDVCSPHENKVIDSVLFVNVAFDKELCPIRDERGEVSGHTTITDRHKLLRLLQYLKKEKNYKYILLDVFFELGEETKWDKELFETIASMPRIVIPCHSDEVLADEQLINKAGLADYKVTRTESDFVKYPYFSDDQQSISVKMYEEMTKRKIEKVGFFYIDGWRLVRSCIVLNFDLRVNERYADDGHKIWQNLGMDLLDDSIPKQKSIGRNKLYNNPSLTNDKYIVIGSFKGDDTHNTITGEMVGAVINFNAFVALMKGHHFVSPVFTIVMFIVFLFLSYLTLSKRKLQDYINNLADTSNNKKIRFILKCIALICSWIGYSLFLSIICVITYYTLGECYDILITATIFSLLNNAIANYDKIIKFIKQWNIGKQSQSRH